jgi:hypothetical protein
MRGFSVLGITLFVVNFAQVDSTSPPPPAGRCCIQAKNKVQWQPKDPAQFSIPRSPGGQG